MPAHNKTQIYDAGIIPHMHLGISSWCLFRTSSQFVSLTVTVHGTRRLHVAHSTWTAGVDRQIPVNVHCHWISQNQQ